MSQIAKKLLFLPVLCCLCSIAFSQKFKGPFQIPFGESHSEVIAAMAKKGLSPTNEKGEQLYFEKVTYGKFKDCLLAFYFINDKFYHVTVNMEPKGYTIPDVYDEVVDELSYTYGQPDSSVRRIDKRYANSTGSALVSLLRDGYADFRSIWKRKEGYIECFINSGIELLIKYSNKAIYEEEKKKKAAKNKADY